MIIKLLETVYWHQTATVEKEKSKQKTKKALLHDESFALTFNVEFCIIGQEMY